MGQDEGTSPALGAGAPGKSGWLRLEVGPVAGRTRLLRAEQRVPLHIGRVLYQQPDWPDLAYLMVTMPTGGFVQGDRVEVDVLARPGSATHVTSQSATRAYRCDGTDIRQELRLELRGDAYLEWWPDPLIPYAGTRFHQTTRLVVDPAATLLFADTLLAGRVARGERHAYRTLDFTTIACRPDGAVLFRDTLRLRPEPRSPRCLGLLGEALALGSMYLIGPSAAAKLEAPLSEAISLNHPDAAGLTRLPSDVGLLVRILAPESAASRAIQSLVLTVARHQLCGHRTVQTKL